MSLPDVAGVPFALVVSLFRAFSTIKPYKAAQSHASDTRTKDIFARWVKGIRTNYDPLPLGTTAALFRLVFPQVDVRRKYGMQEAKLASLLAQVFSLPDDMKVQLLGWKHGSGTGCLGSELERVLETRDITIRSQSQCKTRPVLQVDELLDELASWSKYTYRPLRNAYATRTRSSVQQVLADLFENTTPFEAAVLVQVVLKDLRPLIYPLATTDTFASLVNFKSNAIKPLELHQAIKLWDPSGVMERALSARSSIEAASDVLESGLQDVEPVVGIYIQIPKCVKGQSVSHALSVFKRARCVWAEVKYDGERTQIHVIVQPNGKSDITIFSKTGRDSTSDRVAVHDIVRNALGLSFHSPQAAFRSNDMEHPPLLNVALEAEMVAWSNKRNCIDEFWTIANLIGQTGEDVRGQYIRQKMSYQGAHRGWHHRHLALVFFDILIYNSVSLLHEPYSKRRALLEDLIRPIPRLSMLAERRPIHFDAPIDSPDPTDCLRTSFASVLATHQEGVVLKADNGAYNHWRSPWVKLKKDYIKGLGDSVDICLLGAGWNKDRGRELRVSPVTYTTFYLGARCQSSPHDKLSRPHFEAWFVTEYGLGREALEELNFLIRSLDPLPILQSKRQAVYQMEVGSVSFSGLTSGVPLPSVILRTPLCVEVFGDRFSKDPPYQRYSLRFPRIEKVFRPSERDWTHASTASEVEAIARQAVGLNQPDKDLRDGLADMWGTAPSPYLTSSPLKRKREQDWVLRLETSDGLKPKIQRIPALDLGQVSDPAAPHARNSGVKLSVHSATLGKKTRTYSSPLIARDQASKCPLTKPQSLSITKRTKSLPIDLATSTTPHVPPLVGSTPRVSINIQPSPHVDHIYTPADSPPLSSMPTSDGSPFTSPIACFLRNALIWRTGAARPQMPSRRPSLRTICPSSPILHDFQAFMTGCGWREGAAMANIQKGVVMVEGQDTNTIEVTRKMLLAEQGSTECRGLPIFMIDIGWLTRPVLWTEREFEVDAIMRIVPPV